MDNDIVERAIEIHRERASAMAAAWGRAEVATERRGLYLELSRGWTGGTVREPVYLALAYLAEDNGTGAAMRLSGIGLDGAEALDKLIERLEAS